MSRHMHRAISNDVNRTLNDFKRLPKAEAETLYGIELQEDGSVFDPAFDRNFENLTAWAEFSAEYDEMEYTEDFGHGKQDYDDYY